MAAAMPELPPARRIVLMVDLHPLLHTPEDPKPYLSSVLLSAQAILSHEPLKSSLFAFRPFFSSLSPLLSTSRIHHLLGKDPAALLSFDLSGSTLESISRIIGSLQRSVPDLPRSGDGVQTTHPMSRAASMAESLFELGCDCSWEEATHSSDLKENCSMVVSASPNLVLLLSSLPKLPETARAFVDADADSTLQLVHFSERFARIFGSVNALFRRSGVHLTWVDIADRGSCVRKEPPKIPEFVKKAINDVGWGFCPDEAIVLGSALLPLGLIYPVIASTSTLDYGGNSEKGRAELRLQIADVSGKPLECSCCDLEVMDVGLTKGVDVWQIFSDHCHGGTTKIAVKEVWKNDDVDKVIPKVCGSVMLRAFVGECKEEEKDGSTCNTDFFADRVLQLVCGGRHQLAAKKPVWQLILTFLHRRNLCASVLISRNESISFTGIIRPFSIDCAVLWILKNTDDCVIETATDDACSSQPWNVDPAYDISSSQDSGCNNKANKKKYKTLANLSWSSFCKLVYSSKKLELGVGLEDVYFLKESRISKKLRFVQCWIKQMNKVNVSKRATLDQQSENPGKGEETRDRSFTVSSQQESELRVSSCPSPAKDSSTALFSGGEALASTVIDDLESFKGSLPQKIQHALDSKDVDLGELAERLVELATCAFYASFQKISGDELPPGSSEDDYASKVAAEVSNLLLIRPKEMASKYKSCAASNNCSSTQSADQKVREHELQILFRTEILRSSIALGINESTKTKLIKDICSLLENIEFNLQGGMFSGDSLIGFAERTIKSRYVHTLDDVIHSIYAKMEFFSFDGYDEEDSLSVPNSNHNEETAENNEHLSGDAILGPAKGSASVTSKGLLSKSSSRKVGKSAHYKFRADDSNDQVTKAQESRERARRFSHFTSRLQNLQRVWAPKQLKSDNNSNSNAANNKGRRKCRVSRNVMVLETPISGNKRAYSEDDGLIGGRSDTGGESLKRYLPKALFLDDNYSTT